MSEVLTLGFADENGDIVLAGVDGEVPVGSRLVWICGLGMKNWDGISPD